ncbi:MAG: topoisomerase DNA-binding C4 zinc finger domain-containing protein [Clostridia bacterium]|nr:topoisomerase DNA-binding C4 zinc finger domain-containing protein [Clostridia bacterium]
MDQAVNSLIVELLKSPLIIILVLLGLGFIIFRVIMTFIRINKNINNIVNNEKSDNSEKICPKCGGSLILREGQYGQFYGCSNYPKCKYTEKHN